MSEVTSEPAKENSGIFIHYGAPERAMKAHMKDWATRLLNDEDRPDLSDETAEELWSCLRVFADQYLAESEELARSLVMLAKTTAAGSELRDAADRWLGAIDDEEIGEAAEVSVRACQKWDALWPDVEVQ